MPGRKISRANMQRIQQVADHMYAMGAKAPDAPPIGKAESLNDQLMAVARAVYAATEPLDGSCYVEETFDTYVVIAIYDRMGERYYRADYAQAEDGAVTLAARDGWVEVEEVWQPIQAAAKAGSLLEETQVAHYATMKAVGDRLLEVKVAYGGHKNGRDSHGEYFSSNTDFDTENFPSPPLLYYHGYTEQNKKASRPVVTGQFVSRRTSTDGHYLTYKLKNGRYADLQWDAAQKGACVVSPGTVGHLIRKDAKSGELLYWPLAEISAWDYAPNRAPANLHSVAAPVIKALYQAEGLDIPSPLETTPQETAGDAVSAGADDIDAKVAEQAIAQTVADMLLTLRKGTE